VPTAHGIDHVGGGNGRGPVFVAPDPEPLVAPTRSGPEVPAPHRGLPHVGALDGLRGLAVVAVVLFHSGVALPGGFLGVSTFFTLSGFLITGLLLAGQDRDRTGSRRRSHPLREFWVRRARRLLPAALVALALCALVTARFGDASQRLAFRGDGLAALGYAANWRFIASGQSYASQFAAPSSVLHFWSLAIEEQFYLLFPLLTLGLARLFRASRRVLAIVVGTLFVASASLPHLLTLSHDRLYFGTDTRAAELFAGALLAIGLRMRRRPIDDIARGWSSSTRFAVGAIGSLAFIAVVVSWITTTEESSWVYAGGLPGYAVLTTLVIVAALVPGTIVRAALAVAPLRALGRISYGVYLYHWPILLWLSPARTGWEPVPRLLVASAATLVAATLSFVLLEQPIRERRPWWRPELRPGRARADDPFAQLRRPPVRAGALAPLAVAAVAAIIVVTTIPAPDDQITLDAASGTLISDLDALPPATGPLDTVAPVPRTAPTPHDSEGAPRPPGRSAFASARHEALTPKPIKVPSRPLRVLVVGDSTAVFLDPPLNTWGGNHNVWGAANYARIGCGLTRGGERRHHGIEQWVPPECGTWATEWPAVLRAAQPDIVLVADGFWDATDRRLLGDDVWRKPGDPVYDDFLRKELGAATDVLSSTGAVVAWLDNPPIDLGAEETPRHEYPVNEPARMVRTNEILHEVAATRPSMRVIPYRSFYEAWPGGALDPELRPDGVHVDADGGATVVEWLGPEVLDAYWSVKDPTG
jgi:peptidoglycan/LPS O-acetylase OafA/YrhL